MAAPSVTVEIEFTAGVWTDVTSRVDMETGITINGGRPDVFSQPGPTVMTLTLTAAPASGVPDGAFVPNNPASTYWPNVKRNKRIRVKVTGSSTVQKFIGYIDGWPPVLDGAGEHIATALTATDRQKLLSRTSLRPLATAEAVRAVDPVDGAVFTFPEAPQYSTSSAVNAFMAYVQAGTVGTIVAHSEPPEGTSGALFWRGVTAVTGPAMWGRVPAATGGRFGLWFRSASMAVTRTLAWFSSVCDVTMTSGVLSHRGVALSGRWDDDQWHFLELTQVAAIGTWFAYIDGAQVGTDTSGSGVFSNQELYWCVGGYRNPTTGKTDGCQGWGIGDIVINDSTTWNPTTPAIDIYDASKTGLSGDLTSDRLARIAGGAGFSDYTAFTGVVPVGAQDLSQGLLAAAQELAAAEGTWAEIDHTTGNLRFGSRSEEITPDITVDADGDLVGDGFALDDSDDGFVNAVAVTGAGGAYTATDVASIAALGRVEDSGQTIASDARWVRADAEHRLAVKGNVLPRLPKITIDLLAPTTAGLLDACLAAGTGSRVKVTNLPSWMGRTQAELIAQGWQWTISQDVFTLALDTAAPDDGVTLNDAYRGRVAPAEGALTLSASLSSGATSCTVASTSGNLLSTAGGDYPSWITIDGEDIKVTAVSGGVSPQTLTIVRAQEGTLAAAHASGAVVRLRLDPTLAY